MSNQNIDDILKRNLKLISLTERLLRQFKEEVMQQPPSQSNDRLQNLVSTYENQLQSIK